MIEFKNVSKTYETGNRAVRNIDLKINDGEFVFIVGSSGSGKSTLIKLLTRELKATEGSVLVNGRALERLRRGEVPKYRRGIGIVFQDFRLLNDRNVYENIAFAQRVIGASGREIKENVPRILKLTGLSSKYKNMPNQLSGGEQQRVAIARALINKPSVILADEPTGNLDEKNSKEIMKLLYDINDMGTTVIVITHSRSIVESGNKRVVVMERGVIKSDTGSGTIFSKKIISQAEIDEEEREEALEEVEEMQHLTDSETVEEKLDETAEALADEEDSEYEAVETTTDIEDAIAGENAPSEMEESDETNAVSDNSEEQDEPDTVPWDESLEEGSVE